MGDDVCGGRCMVRVFVVERDMPAELQRLAATICNDNRETDVRRRLKLHVLRNSAYHVTLLSEISLRIKLDRDGMGLCEVVSQAELHLQFEGPGSRTWTVRR
jgi:hypothetical protein